MKNQIVSRLSVRICCHSVKHIFSWHLPNIQQAKPHTHFQYRTHIPITKNKQTVSAADFSDRTEPSLRKCRLSPLCFTKTLRLFLCRYSLEEQPCSPFLAFVETAHEDIARHKLHLLFTDKLQAGSRSLYIHCPWQAVSSGAIFSSFLTFICPVFPVSRWLQTYISLWSYVFVCLFVCVCSWLGSGQVQFELPRSWRN